MKITLTNTNKKAKVNNQMQEEFRSRNSSMSSFFYNTFQHNLEKYIART